MTRERTKSWLGQLREKFPEVDWLNLQSPEEENCLDYVKIYLRREPAPEKDKTIEKYLREEIFQPTNQQCREVLFVRE